MTTAPPALHLDGLSCRRGTRLLFSGVCAAVPAGHLLRVRGDNGSGKTSLLRLVCGLSRPDDGSVLWRGVNIAAAGDAFRSQLVYLGHGAALKADLSALENLQAAQALSGQVCAPSLAAAALALAGFDRRGQGLPARALSQGQRQRAALARLALCAGLPLWVLDEPFSALDAGAIAWLQPLLAAQLARGGVVVLTSHLQTAWEAALPQVAVRLQQTLPELACS